MIDSSKTTIENMATLNNDIVALIDASKISPCEAAIVLDIIRSTLIKAFEIRASKEPEDGNVA